MGKRRNGKGRGSWVIADEMGKRGARGLMGCGLSPTVLVGAELGGKERGEDGRVWAGGERKKMEVR